MKILKNKWFWVALGGLAVLTLIILWLRQYKCENGQYPWENKTLPTISRGKCSFWTGKPIGSTQRQASGCCKDAKGNDCSPCLSATCCEVGFRAGYLENRDVIQTQTTS